MEPTVTRWDICSRVGEQSFRSICYLWSWVTAFIVSLMKSLWSCQDWIQICNFPNIWICVDQGCWLLRQKSVHVVLGHSPNIENTEFNILVPTISTSFPPSLPPPYWGTGRHPSLLIFPKTRMEKLNLSAHTLAFL